MMLLSWPGLLVRARTRLRSVIPALVRSAGRPP